MSDVYRFIVPGLISLLFYFVTKIGVLDNWLRGRFFFKVSLLVTIVFQITTIFLTKFQVGDVMLFSGAGYYFRNGVDFYWIDKDHTQYPFFPFLIFFHAMANKLTYVLPSVNFVQILKLLLLVALYWIASFIYQNSKLVLVDKRKQVLEFLLNPITYAVVLFHGQIDVILIAFFMLSSQLLLKTKLLKGLVTSGLLFGASVATKTWSVIFLPIYLKFFGLKKTIIVGITALLFLFADIFIYTRMVFGSGFRVVVPAVLKPGGPVGIWGISLIFNRWSDFLAHNNLIIFGGLITLGLLLIISRKLTYWNSVCALLIWVYLIIPNWGVQYLFWVVPFLFITNNPKRNVYFLLSGVYVCLSYVNVILGEGAINSNLTNWIGLVLWGYISFMFLRVLEKRS